MEQLLRLDPAGVYADQDFLTRDRYRHAVEAVTRGSAHSELEVAQAAVASRPGRGAPGGHETTAPPTSATTSSTRAGRPSNGPWAARCRS